MRRDGQYLIYYVCPRNSTLWCRTMHCMTVPGAWITDYMSRFHVQALHGFMCDTHVYVKLPANTMVTSSNGNHFRVTGPLCGESTVTGGFPLTKPVTRSFDVFIDLRLNKLWRVINSKNKILFTGLNIHVVLFLIQLCYIFMVSCFPRGQENKNTTRRTTTTIPQLIFQVACMNIGYT